MEAVGIVLVVIVVVALVGVAIYYAHKAEQERLAGLQRLAHENGWSFDPSSDASHDDRYGFFTVFRTGHSRRAYNTITGSHEINGLPHPLRMGDYLYKVTTSNGKTTTTTTYRLSYLLLHLPYAGVPDLAIRPEHVFDKLGAAIGFDDIDFESAEFSRRFHVKSPDKRFTYDVITPAMMEYLLASPKSSVDLQRGVVCITDGVRRWKPEEFTPKLGWITGFLDLWPDHVLRDLQERTR